MTATPWWLGEADAPPPSPRPAVDPAAVQETLAGGLALVASFLRLAAPPAEPGAEDADVDEADLEDADLEDPDLKDPEDAAPEDAAPEAEPVHVGPHLGGECRSCPLCQGLALLREVRPEVVDGLGDVLDSLAATVRSFSTQSGRGSAWD